MITLIIPYEVELNSLERDVDFYIRNEEYEKAAIARDKVKKFILAGLDAGHDVTLMTMKLTKL